jgi:hypothetical protein
MTKLPVLPALRHALQSTLRNLSFAFHISWPWMAIMFPIQVAVALYIAANFPGLEPGDMDFETATQLLSVQLPAGVISLFATSSIAVSWHRYILRDEVPQGWQRLRIDSPVQRYFGNAILLTLIIAAIAFVPAIIIGVLGAMTGDLARLFLVPLVVFIAVIGMRLSVKFPAIALERQDFSFKAAWSATNGNDLPILFLLLALFALALFAGLSAVVIAVPFGWLRNSFSTMVILAIQFVVNWVGTVFSVTILTSLYGYFVEKRTF